MAGHGAALACSPPPPLSRQRRRGTEGRQPRSGATVAPRWQARPVCCHSAVPLGREQRRRWSAAPARRRPRRRWRGTARRWLVPRRLALASASSRNGGAEPRSGATRAPVACAPRLLPLSRPRWGVSNAGGGSAGACPPPSSAAMAGHGAALARPPPPPHSRQRRAERRGVSPGVERRSRPGGMRAPSVASQSPSPSRQRRRGTEGRSPGVERRSRPGGMRAPFVALSRPAGASARPGCCPTPAARGGERCGVSRSCPPRCCRGRLGGEAVARRTPPRWLRWLRD